MNTGTGSAGNGFDAEPQGDVTSGIDHDSVIRHPKILVAFVRILWIRYYKNPDFPAFPPRQEIARRTNTGIISAPKL